MQTSWTKIPAVLGLFWLARCTTAVGSDPPMTVHVPSAEVIVGSSEFPVGTSAGELGIPAGHRPPPRGSQGVVSGAAAGAATAPGSCYSYVPAGAVMVRGY
jgi:hypothetical protein